MKKRYFRFLEIGLFIVIFLFLFMDTGITGILIPISSATYDGSISDHASAVTVDNNDNIIVTGFIFNITTDDFLTIKYSADLSCVLSSATYNETGLYLDHPYGITIDNDGNIIVAGLYHNGSNVDGLIVKYDQNMGYLSSAVYNGPTNDDDGLFGVIVDNDGNIIVVGNSNIGINYNYLTLKYNTDLSQILSSATYDGSTNSFDCARAIAIAQNGNIIVTGYSSNGSNLDCFTIKYNGDLSVTLGSTTYNGPANGDDKAYGIDVDSAGNIIVTGCSYNVANDDYFTIKYNNDLVVISSATYNDITNDNDTACGVAIDSNNNIIVTGFVNGVTNENYFTIKYLGPPQVFSVFPSAGQPGETLDLIINGLNFYSGAGIIFSGAEITINSVDFVSATQLQANITIDSNALAYGRDITVTNIDQVSGVMQNGFEVRGIISYQEEDFRLMQVRPRIFTPNGDGINDVANFIFTNPNNEMVKGMIFDLSGCVVRDNLVQNSDTSLIWDGRDNSGSCVSGKVYVYQIKAGNKIFNGTIILAK